MESKEKALLWIKEPIIKKGSDWTDSYHKEGDHIVVGSGWFHSVKDVANPKKGSR